MSFFLRWPTECDECGGWMVRGTAVAYNAQGELQHQNQRDCTRPEPATGDVCPVCFEIKSVSGACSCQS